MRRVTTGTLLLLGVAFLGLVASSGSARTGTVQTAGVVVNEESPGVLPEVLPPMGSDEVVNPGYEVPVLPPSVAARTVAETEGVRGGPEVGTVPTDVSASVENAGDLWVTPVPGFGRNVEPIRGEPLLCPVPEIL